MNKSVILTLDGPNIDLLPGAISGTILNNNGFYPSLKLQLRTPSISPPSFPQAILTL